MKTKFKIIGITKFAERYLCVEDFELLIGMIGCEVEESNEISNVDGNKMIKMPDGEDTHIDFLELEEVQPEIPFEKYFELESVLNNNQLASMFLEEHYTTKPDIDNPNKLYWKEDVVDAMVRFLNANI